MRGSLGVEDHFRWRIMYHLEKEVRGTLFQSLEIKLGHPPQRKHQPQFDLGLFELQSQTDQLPKSIKPIVICELKVTGYSQLPHATESTTPSSPESSSESTTPARGFEIISVFAAGVTAVSYLKRRRK